MTKEEFNKVPYDLYETDPKRLLYEFPDDIVLQEFAKLHASYFCEPYYSMDKDTVLPMLKQIRKFARARYVLIKYGK